MLRTLFLKGSESRWLRERAVRAPFVRRAASRFMPGESLDDMLRAAEALQRQSIKTVFTQLGENVRDLDEAQAVRSHYLDAIDRIHQIGLASEPSIKLTQLGLDIDPNRAREHAHAIAARAHAMQSYLWIDMEQSRYVDVTLDIATDLRREFPGVGVCLQAYLYRTREDLSRMLRVGAGVRLVKGAYRELSSVAWPRKRDVDRHYLTLAGMMIEAAGVRDASRKVFATHDRHLVARIRALARAAKVPQGAYEIHMLYGIHRLEQARLADAGEHVRALISYGNYWFPWYMRRLAERPANLWFVVRSLVNAEW